LNCISESSDRRFHQYSCGCEADDDAQEVNTQWGRHKAGPFSSPSTPSLKVDFQGSRVTSDGGLILARELDERLGFGELIEEHLTDSRRGKEYAVPFCRPAAAISPQPLGGLPKTLTGVGSTEGKTATLGPTRAGDKDGRKEPHRVALHPMAKHIRSRIKFESSISHDPGIAAHRVGRPCAGHAALWSQRSKHGRSSPDLRKEIGGPAHDPVLDVALTGGQAYGY
jgi:hypothetical protein